MIATLVIGGTASAQNYEESWAMPERGPHEITVWQGTGGDGRFHTVHICNRTNDWASVSRGDVHSRTWVRIEVDGADVAQLRMLPALDQNSPLRPICAAFEVDEYITVHRYETDPNIFIEMNGTFRVGPGPN